MAIEKKLEEQEEIVSMYDELLASVNEVKLRIPEVNKRFDSMEKGIKTMSETISAQKMTVAVLNKQIEDDRKTISANVSIIEKQVALIKDQDRKIKEQESMLMSLTKKIESTTQLVSSAESKINDAIDEAESGIIEMAKEIQRDFQKIANENPKTIKQLKTMTIQIIDASKKVIQIDYDDVDTLEGLYSKYAQSTIPSLIVVKVAPRPWNNDYCVVIKSINNDKKEAWAYAFQGGVPATNFKRVIKSIDVDQYKVYNGPSLNAINDYCQKYSDVLFE